MTSATADHITRWIETNLDAGKVVDWRSAGSSSWASMFKAKSESGRTFFVKTSRKGAQMFAGEAGGLQAMHATRTVRVPNAYHYGALESPPGGSFIVMDYLDMRGGYSQRQLGRKLAEMHLAEPAAPEARAGQFGFPVDNTIGATPQPNGWMDNWVDFLRERRIGHQLRLARDSKLSELGKKLLDNLDAYFDGVTVRPCTLHGDLWSGNIGGLGDYQPVIFDPAAYYGHHEAEFGMSWCAGFSHEFYDAYHELIPRERGFEEREQIYLLYHYLNHYNLFGGGYYMSALSILERLVGSGSGPRDASAKFFDF